MGVSSMSVTGLWARWECRSPERFLEKANQEIGVPREDRSCPCRQGQDGSAFHGRDAHATKGKRID